MGPKKDFKFAPKRPHPHFLTVVPPPLVPVLLAKMARTKNRAFPKKASAAKFQKFIDFFAGTRFFRGQPPAAGFRATEETAAAIRNSVLTEYGADEDTVKAFAELFTVAVIQQWVDAQPHVLGAAGAGDNGGEPPGPAPLPRAAAVPQFDVTPKGKAVPAACLDHYVLKAFLGDVLPAADGMYSVNDFVLRTSLTAGPRNMARAASTSSFAKVFSSLSTVTVAVSVPAIVRRNWVISAAIRCKSASG